MNPTLTFNKSEWNRGLLGYKRATRRTLPEILNSKLFFIAKAAMVYTPRADRTRIERELGAEARTRVSKKTGKTKRSYRVKPVSVAYAIIASARKKRGEPPIPYADRKKEARKLIAGRLKAVGSMKSGWVTAIITLARHIKQYAALESTPRIKGKSRAWPAREGWNPTATAKYRVLAGDRIDPRVNKALQRAFSEELADMKQYTARKLGKVAKRYA